MITESRVRIQKVNTGNFTGLKIFVINLKQTCFVLQDQYDQIAVHTQKGIDFLEKYGNFVDQRCKIEQEYATKLRYVYSRGQNNEP